MVYKVYSGRVGGVFGDLITVEVDISDGMPGFEVIGLAGSEVKEAKDRVRIAVRNSGLKIPSAKVIVNLSPADEHKTGAQYDLPIAIALLGAFGKLKGLDLSHTMFLGELSLDGNLLGVGGVLPIVKMAKDKGFSRVILPSVNLNEGRLIKDIEVVPFDNLSDILTFLFADNEYQTGYLLGFENVNDNEDISESEPDFSEVYGQESVKRAATIAAAGFHHFLMSGPPGSGKSLIAKRIAGIMPELSYEEKLEISTIYSVSGKLEKGMKLINKRPFNSPHHSLSSKALVGGGVNAKPGLVSLSHKGILFLDELPEFKRESLEALRQPLEDGYITISRSKKTYTYPSEFMLVGAMNPCPCGFYPDRNRCFCTKPQIDRYLSKLSGPMLDRIDICVEVPRIDFEEMADENRCGLSSAELRQMVEKAVRIQRERYVNEKFNFNGELPSSKLEQYIPLGDEETRFVDGIYDAMNLSVRSLCKLLRVARTIADLDGENDVRIKHIAEASCYRFPDYLGG